MSKKCLKNLNEKPQIWFFDILDDYCIFIAKITKKHRLFLMKQLSHFTRLSVTLEDFSSVLLILCYLIGKCIITGEIY